MSSYHMEPLRTGGNYVSRMMREMDQLADKHDVSPRCLSRIGLSADRVRHLTAHLRPEKPQPALLIRPLSEEEQEAAIRENIRRAGRIRAKHLAEATGVHSRRVAAVVQRLRSMSWPIRVESEGNPGGRDYVYYVWEGKTE